MQAISVEDVCSACDSIMRTDGNRKKMNIRMLA